MFPHVCEAAGRCGALGLPAPPRERPLHGFCRGSNRQEMEHYEPLRGRGCANRRHAPFNASHSLTIGTMNDSSNQPTDSDPKAMDPPAADTATPATQAGATVPEAPSTGSQFLRVFPPI